MRPRLEHRSPGRAPLPTSATSISRRDRRRRTAASARYSTRLTGSVPPSLAKSIRSDAMLDPASARALRRFALRLLVIFGVAAMVGVTGRRPPRIRVRGRGAGLGRCRALPRARLLRRPAWGGVATKRDYCCSRGRSAPAQWRLGAGLATGPRARGGSRDGRCGQEEGGGGRRVRRRPVRGQSPGTARLGRAGLRARGRCACIRAAPGIAMHAELDAILSAAGALPAEAIGIRVDGRSAFGRDGRELARHARDQYLTAWSRVYQPLRAAFPPERYHAGPRGNGGGRRGGSGGSAAFPRGRAGRGRPRRSAPTASARRCGRCSHPRRRRATRATSPGAGWWTRPTLSPRFREETFATFAFVFPGMASSSATRSRARTGPWKRADDATTSSGTTRSTREKRSRTSSPTMLGACTTARSRRT